ncbi:MAG TPA: acylphosphatase [Syntrophales bacterium]|nr:acylphosphatase [Syntrophales bacterium]
MKKNHVVIEGKVQGVFFRANMQRVARSLDLAGWVRNLPDGRVEAVLEGAENNMAAMLDWCRQGPPYAVVRQVEVTEEPYSGDYRDFSIRY